jgi:hypothetical protein
MSAPDFNTVPEDVQEDDDQIEEIESLNDIGLAKGIVLTIKYQLGMDLGKYAALLGGGEDVTLAEQQKDLIAPTAADFSNTGPTMAHIGQQYTKTSFTNAFPNEPQDLFLQAAFSQPLYNNDIAVHIDPYEQKDALAFLKQQSENLRVEFDLSNDEYDMNSRRGRYEAARAMRDMVEETPTELFDVSMYATARGRSEKEVKRAWTDIKGKLSTSPALTQQITASYIQDKALRTTSPIGKDFIGKKRQFLGGSVAAMLPFTSTSLMEENGVMFGIHQLNKSPIFIDRFERPTSFNTIIVGESGSGKSFDIKLELLRTYGASEDTLFVMLEPLNSFKAFTKVLGGAHVPVGGSVGVNMMEIQPPASVEDAVADGHNPFGQKVQQVSTLLRSYFRKENKPLEEKVSTLDEAIIHTYHRFGITSDIETHNVPYDEQPTVADLIETLDTMRNEPERFTYNPQDADKASETEEAAKEDARTVGKYTDSTFTMEADVIRQHAVELILGLRAFQPGGKYDMLARHTEVDISGSELVYLDLEADEMEDDVGLMMQLLFNMVYERAKTEDKKVVFALDEAHVLMDDKDTLNMLSRAVRHARHYDLSINFITQQPEDFFKSDKSKTIADNCSIKVVHKVGGMDEKIAKAIGLPSSHIQRARGLRTGKQRGDELFGMPYSEALMYVAPYGWVPTFVVASPVEAAIVDSKITDEQEMLDHFYRVDDTR